MESSWEPSEEAIFRARKGLGDEQKMPDLPSRYQFVAEQSNATSEQRFQIRDEESSQYRLLSCFDSGVPYSERRSEYQEHWKRRTEFRHPGISPLHAFGEWNGRPYWIQDWIPGPPLRSLFGNAKDQFDLCLSIFKKVVAIVSECHEQGWIHGALTAEGIQLSHAGEPMIFQFGWNLSDPGPDKDIEALGQILKELLLAGDRVEKDVETIISRTTGPRAYANAGDMAHDLNQFLTGQPVRQRGKTTIRRLLNKIIPK